MELLSWNIASGGFRGYDPKLKSPERLSGIVEAVKKQNADIVGLVDTYRWTEIFTEEQISKMFSYPYVRSIRLDDQRLIEKGHDNGVTILSRLPARFETVRLATRNAIRATIEIDRRQVDIFFAYLDDISEDTRLAQVKALFGLIDPKGPVIFMGDLNTIDMSDLLATRSVVNEFSDKLVPMMPVLNDMMRAEVTRFIKNREFVDLGNGGSPTMPTNLFPIPIGRPVARLE